MKIHTISIRLIFIAASIACVFFSAPSAFSQGFNNNEWIFGHCEGGENNYISFGKDGEAKVRKPTEIGAVQPFGKYNSAITIDPITGEVLFYTDGAMVYNYLDELMTGVAPMLDGDETGRQTVAISTLDYSTEPEGERSFYIFFINEAGEIEYVITDMNEQGGAPAGHPPAGAVLPGATLGPAEGAILVVKASGSPNYLISYEGGILVSREVGPTQDAFSVVGELPLAFTPKAMVFDEASESLLVIPTEPDQDLVHIPFNASDGSFDTPVPFELTGGTESIEGASFSPEGGYVYYSQGNRLFRVVTDDPTAAPQEIPLEADIFKIYDIKSGPDGQLYYIYEETEGGPQFVGRVVNPDEEEFEEVEWDQDPFEGTDFCGYVFPVFAPNMGMDYDVWITSEPLDPCMNNPLQLTSHITPANYQPVSFEWTINPPLTDEEGNELEIDLNQEHLLLPANATSEQSIAVTLTVTFADGVTRDATHMISFQENNLQAQFEDSEITLCKPECIDLMELLEVQSGDQQQGGNYEYFWSNKKEEDWISEAPNEVCEPGHYWVLVREGSSGCYTYASIRVKIWDVEDQSNNIWYFGNGAGLDFNRDPDDPDAPTPRPIEDPGFSWNIPEGVNTISDQAGDVLFYTDGQTVWDLNGNPMQNGQNIGGDSQSSQSVQAIPLPQEETLYYLFTTQAGGANEVKFSLVDIKGDNPSGVGNVVSKDNFLFSPSTQHSAALGAGGTTWLAFHELGNNTFRLYPVTGEGIGQPVFSSVGGNHNFGTGVGSMKFSPDGTKLAVTISEGGKNRVEIFDFDQETGQLTEYAIMDLGSEGEVYGLEFSNDGDRLFVSYRNGGPGVEEFFIQNIESSDDDSDDPTTCFDCFDNANTQEMREQCIMDSKQPVPGTQGLPLGALQIGPDGQIYVAVEGNNQIDRIEVPQDCSPSSFRRDVLESPMPGTSNLGLPTFVQNSGSNIPDPSLSGPEALCLDPIEGAFGIFEGGGEPDIDSYFWTITNETGIEVHSAGGLGEEFQSLEFSFPEGGIYEVELEVDRCEEPWEEVFRMEVEVIAPPELTLETDINLCSNNPVTLTAIEGYEDDEGLYDFVWINAAGDILPSTNSIEVTEESIYTVVVSHVANNGEESSAACSSTASVFVGPNFQFELTQTAEESCYEENYITFAPDTPVSGEWFYQLRGSTEDPVSLGEGFEKEINVEGLPGPGLYDIIFITEDPVLEGCLVEKSVELLVTPLPVFELEVLSPADCETPEGGFEIMMESGADNLSIAELPGWDPRPASAGDPIRVEDLEPGVYTVTAVLNGCSFIQTVSIENSNPPEELAFEVTTSPEACGPDGVELGGIEITFDDLDQKGTYVITRQEDGDQISNAFTGNVFVPVRNGTYVVEVSNEDGCTVPAPDPGYIIGGEPPVEVDLVSDSNLCSDISQTTIQAVFESPANVDLLIEWYKITNGVAIRLPDAGDVIEVEEEGLYEVRLINASSDLECLLGSEQITLLQSEALPPVLQESYTICAVEGVTHTLEDLDDWSAYEWRLGDEIVDTGDSFSPTVPGSYTLWVEDEAGCSFEIPFEVIEDCELKITFPNAIIPGSSSKNFVVYANDFIDEVEVFIYNRWGELIFHCLHENVEPATAFCQWEGIVDGRNVPIGTYPVVVRFKSQNQGTEQVLKKAIVVIE